MRGTHELVQRRVGVVHVSATESARENVRLWLQRWPRVELPGLVQQHLLPRNPPNRERPAIPLETVSIGKSGSVSKLKKQQKKRREETVQKAVDAADVEMNGDQETSERESARKKDGGQGSE